MALTITWSPKALNNFHDILSYLEENWNQIVIKILFTKQITLFTK
jgi:plasmid stabilization system protein ParE